MPIYEYQCKDCQKPFEVWVSKRADAKSCECPSCKSSDVERLLSSFGIGADGGASFDPGEAAGACGTCGDPRGPGSCSWN